MIDLEIIMVPITAFVIILMLSVIWGKYYSKYLKTEEERLRKEQEERLELFNYIKVPTNMPSITCPVLMEDTDEDVGDVLEYLSKRKGN